MVDGSLSDHPMGLEGFLQEDLEMLEMLQFA